jgi:hypothetical protein
MLYAFDGTWNDDTRRERWTNVYKLVTCLHRDAARYYAGVGSWGDCNACERLIGGAFALGLSDIVRAAIRDWLRDREAGVDTIDILGFSRGCMAAVDFIGKIREWEADHRVPKAQRMRLRFAGMMDAVDAIGLPDADWDPFYYKHLPEGQGGFASAVHAVALHETRRTFQVVPVRGVRETVGFIGNHCDIGGGYLHHGLSDIVLAWLHRRAAQAGVAWDRGIDHLDPRPDERLKPHRVTIFNYAHAPRTWPPGMVFHPGYSSWKKVDIAAGRIPHYPLLRKVALGKGGALASKQPVGREVEHTWEFIDRKGYTED